MDVNTLLNLAKQIQNETVENMNSALRVGSLFVKIITELNNGKVDTTRKISGISLESDMTSDALTASLTVATTSIKGLMSADDKKKLDTLSSMLNNNNSDVVDTIAEVLQVFSKYPEGVDLIDLLKTKAERGNTTSTLEEVEKIASAAKGAFDNLVIPKAPIQKIALNGVEQTPDKDGFVSIILDDSPTDQSLSSDSSNPIANAAVTAKFNELEKSSISGINAEVSADETTVELQLLNRDGEVISSTEFPAGGGGTGGDTDTSTKIILVSSVNNPTIKTGDSAKLTYTFDHQYSAGDNKGQSTGQKAQIDILLKFGATTVYSQTIQDVSAGTYEFDLTKYLQVGTTDVYVKATVEKLDGSGTQTKQSYVSVKSYSLTLTSSYNIANNLSGYASIDSAIIPFAVTGIGNKEVVFYLDGIQSDTRSITKSGTTNGSFSIPMASLSVGRHTVQMVCQLNTGTLVINSNSIYFDVYKIGDSTPHIASKLNFSDGRIFDATKHLTPTLEIGQYDKVSFDFAVYNPNQTPTSLQVFQNNVLSQTVSVDRTLQTYVNRFSSKGDVAMKFVCDTTNYPFTVRVIESSINISEVADSLVLKLDASGRSNAEANPATWKSGTVETIFNGLDWSSNGWTGENLKLTNGANIVIPFKVFDTDAAASGKTIEMEFTCSNVIDKEGVVISSLFNNVGFKISTQEAVLMSVAGSIVSTKFASDIQFKIAFVIQKKSENHLMEIYVNGIRSGLFQYATTDSFIQATPQGITVNSESADVLLKNIRVYNRGLSDDEILSNYIIDRNSSDEMVALYDNNQVLDDAGAVSIDKLRAKGKSVIRFVSVPNPTGVIDNPFSSLMNSSNKKFVIPVDVYFYSAFGKSYDFVLKSAAMTIQGTSSTSYPRKNFRIYFNGKFGTTQYNTGLYINGVKQTDFKYSFKPGSVPVSLYTLKADFAESSSTHNTGSAKLINDTWKSCGFLTPPQKVDSKARIGIDGFPIDAFADNMANNVNAYIGKYNFNNDKSGSAVIFGFENIAGFNDAAKLNGAENPCMCLEFLDNSQPLCLFTTSDMGTFASALEFRYPEGMLWTTATAAKKTAIQRLWSWVKSCEGNPTKFTSEVASYFDVNSLTAWYIITEYFMMCDQRVKNIMLATWDGNIWYFIPYDCDTIFGLKNDGRLKYDYTITEDTFVGTEYAFAGHDSLLWNLVRSGMQTQLANTAQTIRTVLSKSTVLNMFNVEQMNNWAERVYNKDGEYKYINPLLEGKGDWTYSLQGSRLAHRCYMVDNRFDLMDAKYLAGTYKADNFRLYVVHNFANDPKNIVLKASERYYFGYGNTSGSPHIAGVLSDGAGSQIILPLDVASVIGDPKYFYGASRMTDIDLSALSGYIENNIDFSNCSRLKKLNVSCASGTANLTQLILNSNKSLLELDITGLNSSAFTFLDLTGNSRLTKLSAGGTNLKGVEFAQGAPIASVTLPATLQALKLKNLNKLTNANLILQGLQNITNLWVEDCALINWEDLYSKLPNVKYLRINDINKRGGAEFLTALYNNNIGGIDADGNVLVGKCSLIGTYQLTTYLDDATFSTYSTYFPELVIKQPEYSRYTMFLGVSNPEFLRNDDNGTGYDPNLTIQTNKYVCSGHAKRIISGIHRYLAKLSKQNAMSVIQLDDTNSTKFLDGSAAQVDGTNGDVMVKFPHYWYKGVNDPLNNKSYICVSSNRTQPTASSEIKILTQADSLEGAGSFYIDTTKTSVSAAKIGNVIFAISKIPVAGYDRIRVAIPPFSANIPNIGGLFLDSNNNVVGNIQVSCELLTEGMYSIHFIPSNAAYLYFTYSITYGFPKIVLGTSRALIEDFEPEWVESTEYLTGAFIPSIDTSGKIRSKADLVGTTTGTLKLWEQPIYDALTARGMSFLTYERRKNISWLYFLKYGNSRMHTIIGDGSAFSRFSGQYFQYGLSALKGITDTVANGYYVTDKYGGTSLVANSDAHSNLFGLENLLSLINVGTGVIKSRDTGIAFPFYLKIKNLQTNILDPRKIPVQETDARNNYYASGVRNTNYSRRLVLEKFLDLFPAGTINDGTNSTFFASYYDDYWGNYNDFSNPTTGLIFSKIGYNLKFGAFTITGNYENFSPGYISARMTWEKGVEEVTDKTIFNSLTEIA